MSCHNRRDFTHRILKQIANIGTPYFKIEIIVVDDGSSDGTAEMLRDFKLLHLNIVSVTIISGPGNWFWSKSMHTAETAANDESEAILWLNDDVNLYEDSFLRLRSYVDLYPEYILVGQCYDPLRERESFGGFKNVSKNPLKLTRVIASDQIEQIDTFCGNFVYVPKQVHERVGLIDGEFEHGHGDLDYGYRVSKSGEKAFSIPGFIGECSKDAEPEVLNRRQAIHYWNSRKKSPIRSQIRFLKRHGGILWPVWCVSPYIRILVKGNRASLN